MRTIEAFTSDFIDLVKGIYHDGSIPLHRPVFDMGEKTKLMDCIDSNFVSSAGDGISKFEQKIAEFTGAKFAVATVNGTSALHLALKAVGVKKDDEVITQSLSFVATANAISYCGAKPIFVDVNANTLGMCPSSLRNWLEKNVFLKDDQCFNKSTGARIRACLPMHTFGHPCHIVEILEICEEFYLKLVEDSAESLGSTIFNKHTGTFGEAAAFSFNGNKIITTGGGGMVITNDEKISVLARHLSATAKTSHEYEYFHDQVGFNYRMPNLNAVLGLSQLEKMEKILLVKRRLTDFYNQFLDPKLSNSFLQLMKRKVTIG